MLRTLVCTVALLPVIAMPAAAIAADRFAFRDGDKVVLLGGAMIEQEQLYGYWETLLTLAYSDRDVTFRNLGWSGDTVWGESRGMFEPDEGYDRLIEHVQQEQPDVILVAYGNNEAFGDEERLEAFGEQLQRLVTDLSRSGRRLVLLSPLLMEASQLPLDAATAEAHARVYNRNAVHYSDVIRKISSSGGYPYVDLQASQIKREETGEPALTDNGLRLTAAGYQQTARWLASSLEPGGNIDRLAAVVDLDFETAAAVALRDVIREKNQLYFHRWRPQNFTYLFGFRKHEQGNNAVEIPQFDPLVVAAEKRIGELKTHVHLSE